MLLPSVNFEHRFYRFWRAKQTWWGFVHCISTAGLQDGQSRAAHSFHCLLLAGV